MIYTLDNTINIGKPVKRVVDANGLEWTHCLYINTETGEITRHKDDPEKPGAPLIDWELGEVVRETIKTAAPVRVEFCDD